MKSVEVIPFTEKYIKEAAKIGMDAFQRESFTSHLFDLSGEAAKKRYQSSVELKLEVSLAAEQPVLLAVKGEEILGAVILKTPRFSLSPLRRIGMSLPRVPRLLPLVFRVNFRRAFRLRGAIAVPRDLPEPYYTVEVLAVHPKSQGKGVGKLLLEKAFELSCKDSGVSGIYLFTGSEETKNMYEHLGYETVEVKEGGELSVYHMFRRIT